MRTAIGILAGVVFLGAMVYVALDMNSVECEVCMREGAREVCNTSAGAERDAVIAQATASVCSQLTGGVTQGIRCTNQRPSRVQCTP